MKYLTIIVVELLSTLWYVVAAVYSIEMMVIATAFRLHIVSIALIPFEALSMRMKYITASMGYFLGTVLLFATPTIPIILLGIMTTNYGNLIVSHVLKNLYGSGSAKEVVIITLIQAVGVYLALLYL